MPIHGQSWGPVFRTWSPGRTFFEKPRLDWVCPVEAAPPFQLMRPWATPTLQSSLANNLLSLGPRRWLSLSCGPPLQRWKKRSTCSTRNQSLWRSAWGTSWVGGLVGRWEAPAHLLPESHVDWSPLVSLLHPPRPFWLCLQPLPHLSLSGNLTQTPSPFRNPAFRNGNVQRWVRWW